MIQWRKNRKGIHFVQSEQKQILQCIADNFCRVMMAHGIIGPIHVLFLEDETKMKVRTG